MQTWADSGCRRESESRAECKLTAFGCCCLRPLSSASDPLHARNRSQPIQHHFLASFTDITRLLPNRRTPHSLPVAIDIDFIRARIRCVARGQPGTQRQQRQRAPGRVEAAARTELCKTIALMSPCVRDAHCCSVPAPSRSDHGRRSKVLVPPCSHRYSTQTSATHAAPASPIPAP